MPTVDFGGGSSFTAQNISSNTTLATFDLAFVDASGGARTMTMPSSPSDGDAVQIVATSTSGGSIDISANTGQSVSGLTTLENSGEAAVFRYRDSDSTWYGTTADVLDRLYDTANDAVTSQVGTSSSPVSSVDTQSATIEKEINDGIVAFAKPGGGSTKGIQARIDELNSEGGGTVIPDAGTFSRGANDPIVVKDNVTVDGLSMGRSLFTIDDGLGNDHPSVFVIGAGTTDAHICNVEIDGNEANNRGATFQSFQGMGIEIGDQSTSTNDRPERCSIRNVYAHDCIRDPIALSGRECTVDTVWCHNSQLDHAFYASRALNCTIENVFASGFTDKSTVAVGTSNYPARGNELANINLHSPAANPETSHYPQLGVELRPGSGVTDDTHISGLNMQYESGDDGQQILADHGVTIDGLRYRGPLEFPSVVNNDISLDDERFVLNNPQITVTNTARSSGQIIRVGKGGIRVRGGYLKEPNTSAFNGAQINGDAVVDSVEISTGGDAISTYTPTGTEIEIGIYRLWTDNSTRVSVGGDTASTYFAHQSMVSQRLADISSSYLFDGRINFNDGGGGNTAGPAYYDGGNSQWVSIVDGTTWS